MEQAQHTPGIWNNMPSEPDDLSVFVNLDGDNIIEVFGRDKKPNARLIAAAPYLLAALQFARDTIDTREPENMDALDHRALKIIDAAIAKAKGEIPCS